MPDRDELDKIELMLSLLNERDQPNINALTNFVRNIPSMHLNIKAFGYDLARRMAQIAPPAENLESRFVGLPCKASTQADIESDWVRYWCGELKIPPIYHRKVWEHAYVLQAIHEHGHRHEGAKGLGFGCGIEPLPSYLASFGIDVTITDLAPAQAAAAGWVETNQHAASLDSSFHPRLVARATFDARVGLRYVDMNAIPDDLVDYDFCWSVCALEHLGSIERGLAFIENSLKTIRPGGIAIHTTEYNIDSRGETIDNWPTVLFQRRHIEGLAKRLQEKGHRVAPLDFSLGDKPLDRFIDMPPFDHDAAPELAGMIRGTPHLKVAVDGFVTTCFGMIVWRGA